MVGVSREYQLSHQTLVVWSERDVAHIQAEGIVSVQYPTGLCSDLPTSAGELNGNELMDRLWFRRSTIFILDNFGLDDGSDLGRVLSVNKDGTLHTKRKLIYQI